MTRQVEFPDIVLGWKWKVGCMFIIGLPCRTATWSEEYAPMDISTRKEKRMLKEKTEEIWRSHITNTPSAVTYMTEISLIVTLNNYFTHSRITNTPRRQTMPCQSNTKTLQKRPITQRVWTDLWRSVGVTTFYKLLNSMFDNHSGHFMQVWRRINVVCNLTNFSL